MKISSWRTLEQKNQSLNTCIKDLLLLNALIAGVSLIPASQVNAQTFTTLYSFTAFDPNAGANNSDGAFPQALILSGDTCYGTTAQGGSSGCGTVFAVNADGTGFRTLHSFAGGDGGCNPSAGLSLAGKTLYGTAVYSSAGGTVFAVNTDGTGFRTLHGFTGSSDGGGPVGSVIVSGNTLYGTTLEGGISDNGTVFKLNTNGTGFATLHRFTGVTYFTNTDGRMVATNSDGIHPVGGLSLSRNILYGTASSGGVTGNGAVFALNTDGTGFTNLHSFTAPFVPQFEWSIAYTNSDGANPHAGLLLSANTLYGAATDGGAGGIGTVYAVDIAGTGVITLHSFAAFDTNNINSDGFYPESGLILSGNTLYGTAKLGTINDNGTVFAINTDGTGFTNLYTFTADSGTPDYTNSDGGRPVGLILSGNTLYGTTAQGGSSGNGIVFSLSLGPVTSPQLAIVPSGAHVILTWPTNTPGFTLQTSPNLDSPTSWTAATDSAVIVGDQYFVTNHISGNAQFFRLKK